MSLLALLAIMICGFPGSEASGVEEPPNRFHALLVGLKYPGSRDSLKFTTEDVRKMAAAFSAASGFDREQCRIEIMVDDDPGQAKPTPAGVKRRLAELAGEAEAGDRLVFYFSGHGLLDGEDRTVLVCDSGESLFLHDVKNIMAGSAALDKLVVIDACHSGGKSGSTGGELTPDGVARAMSGSSGGKSAAGDKPEVAWLVSCDADEQSWEDDASGSGLFTRFLLEALGPMAELADTDYDGRLSLAEIHYHITGGIYSYIREKNVGRDPVWRGRRQTPQVGLGGAGNASALSRIRLFYYDYAFQESDSPAAPAALAVSPAVPDESAESLFNQGLVFYEGKGGNPQYNEAVKLFRRAAEMGDLKAQHYLGFCYRNGWGVARNYNESFVWFQKAADKGLVEAQADVGFMYAHGLGVEEDFTRAYDWSLRAFEQGSAQATYVLAYLLFAGQGVAKDPEKAKELFALASNRGLISSLQKSAESGDPWAQYGLGAIVEFTSQIMGTTGKGSALQWYRKAAEDDIAWAQYRLGECYYSGVGTDQDYSEAVKWFAKAANQGHSYAQNSLGRCRYFGSGIEQNYYEAVKWFRRSADQGVASAQSLLGLCYFHGTGTIQSYSEAVKWYRKAADQGFASAQNYLGYCYDHGTGVDQDYIEAVKWYRKAVDQGLPAAQYNLGYFYAHGQGVDQDYPEAVRWFRKAADQGLLAAQNYLGHCYYQGEGVDQDYSEAVKWYRSAADQGLAVSQYNLGYCYYYGQGVDQDYAGARKWMEAAANQENEDAKIFLKEKF